MLPIEPNIKFKFITKLYNGDYKAGNKFENSS